MANGDKASAKGWTVVPATVAHSTGNDSINYAMDRTADEVDRATAAEAAILTKLGVTSIVVSTTQPTPVNGMLWLKPVS